MLKIALLPYTKERVHEFYKQYVYDPMIFSKDSDIKSYIYSKSLVDDFYEYKVLDPTRRFFAICLNDKTIGEIQIKYIDFDKKCGSLSVALINDSVKGYGYGTQAERLMIDYAFNNLGLLTLYADAVLRNRRSQHVLEKLGFLFTHEDDMLRYYVLTRMEIL